MSSSLAVLDRRQLLARAARCYRDAGRLADACRCFEARGDFATAGRLYEEQPDWPAAARCYEQATQWDAAARCHLAAGMPLDAARCHLAADNPLAAGWLLAHRAHRYAHARSVLARVRCETVDEELALLLARARCAAPKQPAEAGRALRAVLPRLAELHPGAGRDQVMNWAFALASEVLDRPDLTLELLTTAWDAGIDSRSRGEQWARQRLGDCSMLGLLEADAAAVETTSTVPGD